MKFMFLIATFSLLTTGFSIEKEEVVALSKKKADGKAVSKELKIFPDAREYTITVKTRKPGEEAVTVADEVIAKEKAVEGKYIISTIEFPGIPDPMIIVVTFDKKDTVYRRYIVTPDGDFAVAVGVSAPKSRAISWTVVEGAEEGMTSLGQDVHTDEGTAWREVIMKDGKVDHFIEGYAKKTK